MKEGEKLPRARLECLKMESEKKITETDSFPLKTLQLGMKVQQALQASDFHTLVSSPREALSHPSTSSYAKGT